MGALAFSALAAMTLGAFKKDDDDEDNILYQHCYVCCNNLLSTND